MPETFQLDQRARTAVEAALDKKAEELIALDVHKVCGFASTLVICHGRSSRQVQTIAEAVIEAMGRHDWRPHHVEGERDAEWVLIDFMDLVVHVFVGERRRFYGLERLWGDAPRIEINQDAAPASRAGGNSGRAEG